MNRPIVTAALKIEELAYNLDNISTDDSKKAGATVTPNSYTDSEILDEARYVLDLFVNPNQCHINNEALSGDEGPEQRTWARGQVRKLKALIKKFGEVAA